MRERFRSKSWVLKAEMVRWKDHDERGDGQERRGVKKKRLPEAGARKWWRSLRAV